MWLRISLPLGEEELEVARDLREIAAMVGLSKEGIRRVELVALQKLRRALSREQFELLTGQ